MQITIKQQFKKLRLIVSHNNLRLQEPFKASLTVDFEGKKERGLRKDYSLDLPILRIYSLGVIPVAFLK